MRASKFSYGDKKLNELDKDALLDCVETMWDEKNAKIAALEAQIKVYETMLKSPHNIWRSFADNALLLIWASVIMFLLGQSINVTK